ncbi:MAG TPA: hypothetical protein VNT60_02825 [Deinococcales bacterium]|nr:hypothetical protein [Deinococcales bacterium]
MKNRLLAITGIGLLSLALSACGTSRTGVLADESNNPPGNNGTIKVSADAAGTIENEPFPGCTFFVLGFGFDANQAISIRVEAHSPTAGIGDFPVRNLNANAQGDFSTQYTPEQVRAVVDGDATGPNGDYTFKVFVDAIGAPGGEKEKVFSLICAPVVVPPVVTPPQTGLLKLRKIYDFSAVGNVMAGYDYTAAMQANGNYDYPEAIFGGWPVSVTPVNSMGVPTGAPIVVNTLAELEASGGLYLTLPVGRYMVNELNLLAGTSGAVWTRTGANVSEGNVTTSFGTTGAVFVNVTAGSNKANAAVVRFFNVCRINGEIQAFNMNNLMNITTNTGWSCAATGGLQ